MGDAVLHRAKVALHGAARHPFDSRDRVSVRIDVRVLEERFEALLDGVGHDVLPPARLLVDVGPGHAEDVEEQALRQPMFAHDPGGLPLALFRQSDDAVVLDVHETVAFEAGDSFGDRRLRLLEAFDKAGAQRRNSFFFEFVHGLEVHLSRVD